MYRVETGQCPFSTLRIIISNTKRGTFLKYATFFRSKNSHSYCTFAKSAVNLFISVSETSPEVTTNLKRKVVD